MVGYQGPVEEAVEEKAQDVKIANGLIHPVECRTCQGEGRLKADCESCEGSGQGKCSSCNHRSIFEVLSGMKRLTAIQMVISPKQAEQRRELSSKAAKQARNSVNESAEAVWLTPPEGYLRCPNFCLNGSSFLARGAECKVCKGKGRVKCKTCKGKSRRDCLVCKGKRQVFRPCPECSGCGQGNDPLLRTVDAESCPWCNDARIRACGACDAEASQDYQCGKCSGSGKQICSSCFGYKKIACRKCSGTGDLSGYYGPKNSNRCDDCKGKGVRSCNKCSGGKNPCTLCEGNKRIKGRCRACLGQLVAPCEGCWYSSELAWTVTAERLFAAGKIEEAVQHMDVGVGRAYLAMAEKLIYYTVAPDELKALKRDLDRKIGSLEKRFKEMKKLAKSDNADQN
jgi:hypothetical protein